jgi:hypothetical protein
MRCRKCNGNRVIGGAVGLTSPCPDCVFPAELLRRAIESMEWMVEDMKWRFNEAKDAMGDGSTGGYSDELLQAIEVLEELKGRE